MNSQQFLIDISVKYGEKKPILEFDRLLATLASSRAEVQRSFASRASLLISTLYRLRNAAR